jgi:hypothetical protein
MPASNIAAGCSGPASNVSCVQQLRGGRYLASSRYSSVAQLVDAACQKLGDDIFVALGHALLQGKLQPDAVFYQHIMDVSSNLVKTNMKQWRWSRAVNHMSPRTMAPPSGWPMVVPW